MGDNNTGLAGRGTTPTDTIVALREKTRGLRGSITELADSVHRRHHKPGAWRDCGAFECVEARRALAIYE